MASDFSITWQFLSKRTIVFFHNGSNSTPRLCNFFLCTTKTGLLQISMAVQVKPASNQGEIEKKIGSQPPLTAAFEVVAREKK
jgi:hypothetical protein